MFKVQGAGLFEELRDLSNVQGHVKGTGLFQGNIVHGCSNVTRILKGCRDIYRVQGDV